MIRRELATFLARRVARNPLAREIRDLARATQVPVWLVGGFVRDAALGRRGRDLDLSAGRGAPRFVAALEDAFKTRGFRFHKRGVTTWRFHLRGGEQLDVVDAGRRGIHEDLARRELTINAIAFDLVGESIFDPLRGLADLRAHRLRLPRRGVFDEDPLRAVRAARFLAELPDFTLQGAARAEARGVAGRLRRAAVERVREELGKLLSAAAPRRGLFELQALGLIDPLLPELKPMRDCAGGRDRPDVWTHTLDCIGLSARPLRAPASHVVQDADSRRILRWALLLHDISKPETLRHGPTGTPSFHGHEVLGSRRAETLLRRLRLPRVERKRIERLVLNHLRPGHLADAGIPPRGVRRLVRDAGADLPLLVFHAACDAKASGGPADRERWRRMRATLERLSEIAAKRARKPLPRLLDGDLLIETLGLEPGPRIGRILREVRDAQEAGSVRTAEAALKLARDLAADDV